MNKCHKCKQEKPPEMFGKDRSTKSGLARQCRVCKSLTNRTSYEANPEKATARTLQYYYENHEAVREQQADWRKSNRGYINAYEAKRAAQKSQRTPAWLTDADRQWMEDIYTVSKEVSEVTEEPHHVDHIMPLRGKLVSGLHVPWNLQILPAQENMSKGNRLT